MGAGAEHRGNRHIRMQADAQLQESGAKQRADRAALQDELARLRDRVAELEEVDRKRRRQVLMLRLTLTMERMRAREERERADGAYRLVVGKLARLLGW